MCPIPPNPTTPAAEALFPPKDPPNLPSPPALSITWLHKSPCQKPFLRFPIPGLGSAEEQNRNPSCAHKPHRKIIQKSAKEPFGGSAVTSALNQATGTIPPGPRDVCCEQREENPQHFAHSHPGSRHTAVTVGLLQEHRPALGNDDSLPVTQLSAERETATNPKPSILPWPPRGFQHGHEAMDHRTGDLLRTGHSFPQTFFPHSTEVFTKSPIFCRAVPRAETSTLNPLWCGGQWGPKLDTPTRW